MNLSNLRPVNLPDDPAFHDLFIGVLNYKERIEWERKNKSPNSDPIKTLILKTVVKADGSPGFTSEQVDALDAPQAIKLWAQAGAVNMIDSEDLDDLKKSSKQAVKSGF
jgi:hypothetical protein